MPHPVALSGFAAQPERYEAGRPSYPASAVDFVVEQIDPRAGDLILDVGAGTGKLTRALTGLDARLVAVEPVFEMARLIVRYAPGVPVIRAAAEALPVSSGTVAAITVAQAFHWFDSDRAWDEFGRVVRSGGVVALMWNARLRETPWVDAVWTVMDAVERHAPWRKHETRERYGSHPAFGDVERTEFRHVVPMTVETVIARIMSVSHVAVLPQDQQDRIRNQVAEIVESVEDSLEIIYRTDVLIRRRV